MSDDLTTRARELLAGITPGLWIAKADDEDGPYYLVAEQDESNRDLIAEEMYSWETAQFIAAAPQLVEQMADRLDAIREKLDEWMRGYGPGSTMERVYGAPQKVSIEVVHETFAAVLNGATE